jgi:hypothetical protein
MLKIKMVRLRLSSALGGGDTGSSGGGGRGGGVGGEGEIDGVSSLKSKTYLIWTCFGSVA